MTTKTLCKRVLSLALCALLLLSLLGIYAAAATPEDELVQWSLSADGERLLGNERTYYAYHAPHQRLELLPQSIYVYANTVTVQSGTDTAELTVYAPHSEAELVWLADEAGNTQIYLTEAGQTHMQRFLTEGASYYRLWTQDGCICALNATLVQNLLTLQSENALLARSVSGSTLARAEYHTVGGMDSSATVMRKLGEVVILQDGYYFLDYTTLPDNIDIELLAQGTQTATLFPLGGTLTLSVSKALADASVYNIHYSYEDLDGVLSPDELFGDMTNLPDSNTSTALLVLFWICFVLFGLLLPVAAVVFGLLLPHRKNLGCPKHWYLLAGVGIVWLLVAVALLIVLLVAS